MWDGRLQRVEAIVERQQRMPPKGDDNRLLLDGKNRRLGFLGTCREISDGLPEPRRVRDRDHVRFVAKQPCLVCGRLPADSHHLRFAQSRALGRKVSDEFTVPLCRGHHREVHRCGNEAAWWQKAGLDPADFARALWLETHPIANRSGQSAS